MSNDQDEQARSPAPDAIEPEQRTASPDKAPPSGPGCLLLGAGSVVMLFLSVLGLCAGHGASLAMFTFCLVCAGILLLAAIIVGIYKTVALMRSRDRTSPESSIMTPPILETQRLTMRGHRHEDFAASAAMWGDPEVARHISGRPSTREESWARLLRYPGLWSYLGFGYWVVEEKASGRFVGEVGFADFKREIEPSLGESAEMGWVLAPWSHGKGYASEAVAAGLAWADKTISPLPIVCIVAPENPASIRVAEKAGFREFARGICKEWPTTIYRRDKPAR
jgi:RimJ/RimL family protein N-acetyltransferase